MPIDVREDILRGVTGFNAKEDPRHDRRTLSLDELRRLIEAAQTGPMVAGDDRPGPSALLPPGRRLGVALLGDRQHQPESFDWKAPSVTVAAAYTKNGETGNAAPPE